jgi:acyl carrier protein
VLGGLGYSTYAAANLFMDAFAHHRAQMGGLPWTTINFGRWKFAEEVERGKGFSAMAERSAMTAEEGVEAFRRILCAAPATQIIVSTRDLAARISQWKKPESSRDTDQTVRAEAALAGVASTAYSRPNMPNAYVAPSTETEQKIASIWQELLGIGQIGIHDNFLDLGGHSLIATQIISRIRSGFSVEVPLRTIFESQTVAEMAAVVTGIQRNRVGEAELAQMLHELEGTSEQEI